LSNYGGLEAISAIRNNEIDVKSEVAKNSKLIDISRSPGEQWWNSGKF
jgi:hypothetical protein